MAAFEYKALNAKGRTVKGVIEADTARQARQMLGEKSLVPMEVAQTHEKEQQKQSASLALSASAPMNWRY